MHEVGQRQKLTRPSFSTAEVKDKVKEAGADVASGKTSGQAAELRGEAKGKASELKGKAKEKVNEV